MANLLGLGVFGTFGQPHGFQQAFNQDVRFSHSLDLNSNEIEMFPNTEMYAVKKEMIGGVYSVCFCMYSYFREMNANRSTTFLGSCIVLQQVYIDADKIYKLLRELHDDLVNNPQNVNNNTIQVRQVVNLVVREPSHFQSLKFAAKSIDDTSYYSTGVDTQKKYFIKTEHIESSSQIIAFFEEGLRGFNDVESLYFTFSDKIMDSVAKKGTLKTISWEEFVDHKNQVQQDAVTSKKGLKPTPAVITEMPAAAVPAPQAPATPVAPAQPAAAPAMETPSPQTVPSQAKQSEYDPAFPFDEWETPTGPWALDDLLLRVSEHNRLVAHGRRLLVRNEDILQAVKAAAKQDATPVAEVQDATPEKPGEKVAQPAKQNQQFFGGIPINNGTHDGEEEAGYESKPFHKKKLFPVAVAAILLFVAGAGITYKYKYALRQHFGNKKDTIAAADTTQPPPLTRTEDTAKLDNASDAAQAADEPGTNDKKTGAGKNGSGLSPLPNMEVAKSEAISFSREGVRDKSLPELTNRIFQEFQSTVGDFYKHQFTQYSMSLLDANRDAFKKKGGEYVCNADAIMHIPAFKESKAKVVFPK